MAATPSPSPSPSSSPPTQPTESQSLLVASAKPILLAIPVQTQKKTQAVQWTPEETANLIQAYQDKWYSLKKGQLKAHQWEEVTVTVAVRCGYDEPTKTSTQCRHKMEKLRKRYRAEKRKGGGRSSSSAWPFFDLMDRMERPIFARPMNMVRFHNSITERAENDDDDDHRRLNSRSRSINNLLSKPPTMVNSIPGSPTRSSSCVRKREELIMYTDGGLELEEKSLGFGKKRLLLGLAAEMRAFEQRIAWVEKKKMQMMRQTEKMRMEMESKRMQMILDSQAKILETINNGGPSLKKTKIRTAS